MRARKRLAGGAVALLAAACGSTPASGPANSGTVSATSAEITEYQNLSRQVQSAATAYGARMNGTAVTIANCKTIHDQYDAEVRPWISRMAQMAGDLDAFVSNHGGGAAADVTCASASMLNEIDHHRSVACTFSSLAADQDEAARDASAIMSYASHARARCREMLGNGGGSCCNWSPMMNGCANWSSTCCSSMMRWGCCGGMMTGGGMMHGGSCCGSGW